MNINLEFKQAVSFAHPACPSPAELATSAVESTPLSFLLVYEDTQTGLRARQIMNQLTLPSVANAGSKPVLFRFEFLSMREIWELAAKQCQTADVLVISAHSGDSVPAEVKSWILYWLGLKGGHPHHVVASFDAFAHASSGAESTLFYLQSLAVWANARLTTHFGDEPLSNLDLPLREVAGLNGNTIARSLSLPPGKQRG